MVYHPNEFETAITLGQNEPLYCNVPDSLSESLARARLDNCGDEDHCQYHLGIDHCQTGNQLSG